MGWPGYNRSISMHSALYSSQLLAAELTINYCKRIIFLGHQSHMNKVLWSATIIHTLQWLGPFMTRGINSNSTGRSTFKPNHSLIVQAPSGLRD